MLNRFLILSYQPTYNDIRKFQSKAWVYSRSILGSQVPIPLRHELSSIVLCCVLCSWRPLRQADKSFKGV